MVILCYNLPGYTDSLQQFLISTVLEIILGESVSAKREKFFLADCCVSQKIRDGCSYCQIFDGEHGHTGSLCE